MSKSSRRTRHPVPNAAEQNPSESVNSQEVEEEPLSRLRKRVFQPIQTRIYGRLNQMVDKLGYFSAAFLLLAVTAATTLGVTFWNDPAALWKALTTFRFYASARHLTPPRNNRIQEIIDELNNQLTEESNSANRDRPDRGFSPWTEGQMAVALQGTDVFDFAELAQWFHEEAGDCHCWRAGIADRENVAATAWVLLAFARMGAQPSPEEVSFLLDNQHKAGWWQVFPAVGALRSKAVEDPRNASTYATSFSIFALQELLKRKLITEGQQPRAERAIAKGRSWLLTNTVPGQPGRWKDYPNGNDAHVSIGISGIALHALHRTPGLPPTASDADWMAQLPTDLPAAGDVFISGQSNGITLTEFARDGTHMFAFPWLIVGTIDAYPQGNLAQRAQAIRLMNDTPREGDAIRLEARNKSWVAAEFLIALRYLRGDDVL